MHEERREPDKKSESPWFTLLVVALAMVPAVLLVLAIKIIWF